MLERVLSEFRHRLRALFRRADVERELDEELALHLELERQKLVGTGMSPEEAARAAALSFGGVERIKDASRDMRGIRWLDVARQDGGHAIRQLTAHPGFAGMVVLTLALGVGANTALFTLLDHLLLRPPSGVHAPEQLFRLYRHQPPTERSDGWVTPGFPYPAVANIAAALDAGQQILTYRIGPRPLGRGEDAPRVTAVEFGPGYFDVLGVRPVLGRRPTAEEARIEGGSPVALISDIEWQSRYGRDPGVIGRQVELLYQQYTIIGVLPRAFTGLDAGAAAYWTPLGAFPSMSGDPLHSSWNYGGTHVVIRAAPAMRERVVALASGVVARGAPEWIEGATVTAASIKAARGPHAQPAELAVATRLAAVAAILLLIACANVANLNLARTLKRRQEIAVRLALGISRGRLIAMLTLEMLLLALLAAGGALLVAFWGGTALRRLLFPDLAWAVPPLDVRVAVFALATGLAAGLLSGLPPALRAGRFGLAMAMKGVGRQGGAARSRLRSGLVSVQAALCVVLLVAAGSFIRSLQAASAIDVGFDAGRVALAGMSFSDRANHDAEVRDAMPRIVERLRTLPQVEEVATTNWRPLSEHASGPLYSEAGEELVFPRQPPSYQLVSPNFFEAMGMRLVAGRIFDATERDPEAPVIVINQAMAADVWPGENPLGRCLRFHDVDAPCARVIGIVETANRDRLIEPEPVAHFYRSLAQSSNPTPRIAVIRARPGELASVLAAARTLIREDLPAGAFPDVKPLASAFDAEMRPWRLGSTLFSAIGLLALLVAVIGTYSVVAYIVGQRRHEIGVRMALGARALHIARMVVSDALGMVGAGLVVGVAAAFAFGRALDALLYETSARDPGVIGAVTLLLGCAAVGAALVPAWRATRVDPTEALRAE